MIKPHPKTIRLSILDNLRHNPDGISKTRLAGLVERDTGAALDPILTVYATLERRGELYEYDDADQTTVRVTHGVNQ